MLSPDWNMATDCSNSGIGSRYKYTGFSGVNSVNSLAMECNLSSCAGDASVRNRDSCCWNCTSSASFRMASCVSSSVPMGIVMLLVSCNSRQSRDPWQVFMGMNNSHSLSILEIVCMS